MKHMPRFDGTGPEGKGPKTGRGQGRCDAEKVPEQQTEAPNDTPRAQGGAGRGFGRGVGRGFGFRRFFGGGRNR